MEIELRQTHVSYLLFTPDFVYKIKKPVDFGFLDFTSLEKRRFFCEEEVRLNRRLAPGAYLGVSRVTEEGGAFFVDGPGKTVEYAVKMKRLDNGQCLSTLIASDRAAPETVAQVARAIASFHQKARTGRAYLRLRLDRGHKEKYRRELLPDPSIYRKDTERAAL
ncbi:MAG: hypothetical protein QY316_00445 [Thermodesulfobacteriota bacterium]|nr:MAG: hypothetical protein QY316_00445 [Thermodesulfobacteriota bacterium]